MKFIDNLKTFFLDSWKKSKFLFICEMVGAILGVTAAMLITLMAPNPPFLLAFIFYNLSAILIWYTSVKNGAPFTALLMIFYLITTTIGIIGLF